MKQITSNGKDWLFVEIPEDAVNLSITSNHEIEYKLESTSMFISNHISLPIGAMWRILNDTENISYHQILELIEKVASDGDIQNYLDTINKGNTITVWKAFKSFLTHHNLTGRYAILRKI
jgi:hypothetical protein